MWYLSFFAVSLFLVHSTCLESPELTDSDNIQDETIKAQLRNRRSQLDEGRFEVKRDYAGQMDQTAGLSGSTTPSHSGTPQPMSRAPNKIRDVESIAHSAGTANSGFLSVSGGSGKGQHHLGPGGLYNSSVEVKSDKSIPLYCPPPNPCPKGYTSANGCEESFVNTAEEQKARTKMMMAEGVCRCDHGHIHDCPNDQKVASKVPPSRPNDAKNRLNKIGNSTLHKQAINQQTNQSASH